MPKVKRATRRSNDAEKAAYIEYANLQALARNLQSGQASSKGARYRSISLDALTALDLPTARALIACPSQTIELGALTTLSPEVAKALSESSAKRIKLTGLASDQVEAVKLAFSTFKGSLQLPR